MGRRFAQEIAEYEEVSLGYKVGTHLSYNHFPPVSLDFVEPAVEAIYAVDGDEGDAIIALPNGKNLSAWDIVEGLHLESFLHHADDDDYSEAEWTG